MRGGLIVKVGIACYCNDTGCGIDNEDAIVISGRDAIADGIAIQIKICAGGGFIYIGYLGGVRRCFAEAYRGIIDQGSIVINCSNTNGRSCNIGIIVSIVNDDVDRSCCGVRVFRSVIEGQGFDCCCIICKRCRTTKGNNSCSGVISTYGNSGNSSTRCELIFCFEIC